MSRESVESLCQKAQQAVARGANDTARQIYLQALGLKADAPDAHYGLATVCFLLNDLASAAYHFKEVTRLDPLRAGAHINLGAVYNRMDLLDEAIPVLRRGIQLDQNRAEGFYNLGVVYRRKGQLDLAVQAYREAVRINPRMYDAHYNIANIYLEKGQHGLALAHYKQALEVRPNWDKALHGLEQCEAVLFKGQDAAVTSQGTMGQGVRAASSSPLATRSSPPSAPPAPRPSPSAADPQRTLNAESHGKLLTSLHQATAESDTVGQSFVKILEKEIEPAIKELSAYLLHPDTSINALDLCLQKCETAVANMRGAQEAFKTSMHQVQKLGDQLLRS